MTDKPLLKAKDIFDMVASLPPPIDPELLDMYDAIVDGFVKSCNDRVAAGKSKPLTDDDMLTVYCFAAWLVVRYVITPCEYASNGKIT